MRSLRLPWHRRTDAPHPEPALQVRQARPVVSAQDINDSHYESSVRREGGNAILELIGGPGIEGRLAPAQHDHDGVPTPHMASAAERTDALVETLHAQYWRALTEPHVSLASSWAGQPEEEAEHALPRDPQDEWPALRGQADSPSASIEALLSGERTLEDVFGQLESGATPALEVEPVPEVLRVFAPPEFHAAAARRAPALPPALTRREHHALSIDSPLAAPSREDNA